MTKETNNGMLSLIGIGPGDLEQLTLAAQQALQTAEVVIGYEIYIEFVRSLLDATKQQAIVSPIGNEMDRARQAVELASQGQRVALISSGDIGIYAMASPVFEVLREQSWDGHTPAVTVYPGISAIQASAARLGAPLGHDFCTISLSDLLTPWSVIERRLQAAAWGDFVIAFYNPRSKKRDWQLQSALDILQAYRPPTTPIAIVRNITRPDEQVTLTTLAEMDSTLVDMFTMVLVGNSQSYVLGQRVVTPRGYVTEEWRNGGIEDGRVNEGQSSNQDVYPLTLTHMQNTTAIVVGGGPVGERKVKGLLAAQAKVAVISPAVTPQLEAWATTGDIQWIRRPFQAGDLSEAQLAFAATNQRAVNAQVATEAQANKILCNVADQPDEGGFHVPAVHRQTDLVVAVSTTGKNPRQARDTRNMITTYLEAESIVNRKSKIENRAE